MSRCPTLSEARTQLRCAFAHLQDDTGVVSSRVLRYRITLALHYLHIADRLLTQLYRLHYPTVAAPRGQGPAAKTGDQGPGPGPNPF